MASAEDWAAWASVPWTAVPATSSSTPLGWHKTGVPYLPPGQALLLQTLDIWIPNTDQASSAPDPTTLPSLPGTWIVYIHGGAWRDPAIDSTSFSPAATLLLSRGTTTSSPTIAGLVSLNYRLSPHPSHPAPSDPARQAAHPDHITDVLTGLAFLHRLLASTHSSANPIQWILAGHSCGATLAFQAVASPSRWGLPLPPPPPQPQPLHFPKPTALIGFEGLYDLAGFIASPPEHYAWLREGYREFVSGAFGDDETVWRAVCPAREGGWEIGSEAGEFVKGWVREWVGDDGGQSREGEGRMKKVVLVQSWEDSLVPWQQVEVMRKCWGSLEGVDCLHNARHDMTNPKSMRRDTAGALLSFWLCFRCRKRPDSTSDWLVWLSNILQILNSGAPRVSTSSLTSRSHILGRTMCAENVQYHGSAIRQGVLNMKHVTSAPPIRVNH
ncbi:hypothetical protein VTJ49DRAFT_4758 [Mycothermus thermophilus]|uniref:Kynurenine formamidase n=1 Tax=Humicola insolens TaxID=85995 RepID=A0ABR3V4K2_HUMIN